jgi:tRNA A37 threonylcarbamoyltransferase TsaD
MSLITLGIESSCDETGVAPTRTAFITTLPSMEVLDTDAARLDSKARGNRYLM